MPFTDLTPGRVQGPGGQARQRRPRRLSQLFPKNQNKIKG